MRKSVFYNSKNRDIEKISKFIPPLKERVFFGK
jgi:hypothetical protein